MPFTQSIISHLANDPSCGDKGKVFFCWGKHAEKMLDAAHVDAVRPLALLSFRRRCSLIDLRPALDGRSATSSCARPTRRR